MPLLILALVGPSLADVTGKRPRVLDGDTLEIAGLRVRLHGIDAPELEQTCAAASGPWACGREARWAMLNRIGQNWVTCVARGRDEEGTLSAVCYLGGVGGPELNAWLVSQGWALAFPPRSDDYRAQEDEARRFGRGIWRGSFVAPWAWRAGDGR